jgi:hypothetical protein
MNTLGAFGRNAGSPARFDMPKAPNAGFQNARGMPLELRLDCRRPTGTKVGGYNDHRTQLHNR